MADDGSIVRINDSPLDRKQVLSRRLSRLAILAFFLGSLFTVTDLAYAQILVHWPDCPPPEPQVLPYDPATPSDAHFQWSSPAVNCFLDVVSGSVFSDHAGSAGGFQFSTPGEISGDTYTIAFDMQWLTGGSWSFANETAEDGDTNGLNFHFAYPGDSCWHHYEYTAATGAPICATITPQACPGAPGAIDGTCPSTAPVCQTVHHVNSCVGTSPQACGDAICSTVQLCGGGAKDTMFVYQNAPGPQQEMRIADLTLRRVASTTTPQNVVVVSDVRGGCPEPPEQWTTNAYNSFRVRLPVGKDSDACLTESEGAVINNCTYQVSVVFDSPIIFRKDPIIHTITAQNYVHGTGAVGATCTIWSYDGNGNGEFGTNQTFKPNGAQALNFTSLRFGNTISLLCDLPVGEGISALQWNP